MPSPASQSLVLFPQIKEYNSWTPYSPENLNTLVTIEHKIDGSNFQVIFTKTDTEVLVGFASRHRMLFNNDKLFKYKETFGLPKYSDMLDRVSKWLKASDYSELRLFGELYGLTQKRIKYTPQPPQVNLWKAFALMFDNKFTCPKEFYSFCDLLNIDRVECVKITSLKEAVETNLEDPALIKQLVPFDNSIEGVVIKPFEWTDDPPFDTIKLKTEKFKEVEHPPTKSHETKTQPQNIKNIELYFTTNRLDNVYVNWWHEKLKLVEFYELFVKDALGDYNIANNTNFSPADINSATRAKVFLMIKDFLKNKN